MAHDDTSVFSSFWKYDVYLKPYRVKYLISFFVGLISVGLYYLTPYLFKVLIDDVLVRENMDLLYKIIAFFLVTILLASLFDLLDIFLSSYVRERFEFDLKKDIFKKLETASLKSLEKNNVGNIYTTIETDAENVTNGFFSMLDDISVNLFLALYILVMIFLLDARLALLAVALLPVLFITQKQYGIRLEQKNERYRTKYAQFVDFLQERIRNIKQINLYCKEEGEFKNLETYGTDLVKKKVEINVKECLSSVITNFMMYSTIALLFIIGGYFVLEKQMTIGTMVAIYTYFLYLSDPITKLSSTYISLKENIVSTRRISEFLESCVQIKDRSEAKPLVASTGILTFDRVRFGYDKHPILNQFSCEFKPGKVYCIMGPSGSGKTTVLNLLYRFYDPQAGNVLFDGLPLQNIQLASLRREITLLEAETVLFNTTILENIKYGNPEASMHHVMDAAKAANIHEFIQSLPKKYETHVGELETELSEGQKQRIALARAILKNSQVLLFDETTAALDAESEQQILVTIRNLAGQKKTIIIVAHRLSTIESADEIMVLDKGRIVEKGTLQELLHSKGKFFELYNLESHGYKEFMKCIHDETQTLRKRKTHFSIAYLKLTNVKEMYAHHGIEKANKLLQSVYDHLLIKLGEHDVLTRHQSNTAAFFMLFPKANTQAKNRKMNMLVDQVKMLFPTLQLEVHTLTVTKPQEPQALIDLCMKSKGNMF